MTDIITNTLNLLTPAIIVFGPWIYIFVGLVALLESTPIVGTFTPGTFIMLFCGFMVAEGFLDFYPTLIATILGAVLGDMIGYYFGRYGRRFIHDHKGLLRTAHIEMGRGFFTKHGGKSVALGRFTGPVRSIIPVVAGSVHMSMRKFLSFNIVGAVIWAYLYISLGYIFGSQLSFIDKLVTRAGLVVGIVIIAVLAVFFNIRKRDGRKK